MASGASGVAIDEELYPALLDGLLAVSRELALGIVRGGEGATKLISDHRPRRADVDDARSGGARRSPIRRWSRPPCTAPIRTGVASSPPPAARACSSTCSAPPCTSAASCCSRTACRTTTPRRRPRKHLKGDDIRHRGRASAPADGEPPPSGHAISAPNTCGSTASTERDGYLCAAAASAKDFLSDPRSRSRSRSRPAAAICGADEGRPAARPQAPTASALAGLHVALLFEKPSLRTRSTFEIAVRELGGDTLHLPAEFAEGTREPLEDVARNLERWVRALVMRTFAQEKAATLGGGGAEPARHQRAHRRGASVPGARRHADAAGAMGRLPRPHRRLRR